MDCETCTDDMTAYLDGELSEKKTIEVESHLEVCPSCREDFRSLEMSARFVETHLSEAQVPAEIWGRVRTRIGVMEAPAPSRSIFDFLASSPWWGAASTAVVTALLVLGIWGYMRHQEAQQNLEQYMTRCIQTRESQEHYLNTSAGGPESAPADANLVHPEYLDNPFAPVKFVPDVNPFRSEEQ